jgi:N-acetylglucosaminyldiphosphoundecaprenol N-acetyl-beta-D-mannosaminyltransferase
VLITGVTGQDGSYLAESLLEKGHGAHGIKEVDVATLRVADLSRSGLLSLVENAPSDRPYIWLALHISSLREAAAPSYSAAVNSADVRYADGASIVALARLAGAKDVARYPTTDLGSDLLDLLATSLHRTVRVALLGGPNGLADEAGKRLEQQGNVVCVGAHHGYSRAWEQTLHEISSTRPDVLFVGLGVPLEHLFVTERRAELPNCFVVTCGGWFGFLTGCESRAPRWMQRAGLEWCFRLAQQPSRLFGRYFLGFIVCAKHAALIAARRALALRTPSRSS